MVYVFRLQMEFGRYVLARVPADSLAWGWRMLINAVEGYNILNESKEEVGPIAYLETLEYLSEYPGTLPAIEFPVYDATKPA